MTSSLPLPTARPPLPRTSRRAAMGAAIALSCVATAAWAAAAADDGSESPAAPWWLQHTGCAACAVPGPSSFDEVTGRSLLNYPPHRYVDLLHMKLELSIADMNRQVMDAVQTLTMTPINGPVETLTLDAAGLEVASVGSAGRGVSFEHAGDELRLTFDPPLSPGERAEVVTRYRVVSPLEGMHWTPESPAWPGRPAQVHTQGEPESNRYWFPCRDFPNERLSTEIVATVPDGFAVCSNGRLVDRSVRDGRATFHWLQEKPHVPYLVTFVVGKFDIVDVGGKTAAGAIDMPVYAPPGKGRLVKQTYGRTAEMVRLFERLIDEPYPWDKYAQVVVNNFFFGGMENTSATTMFDSAVLDKTALLDGDLDGLISHELAHQWFGDLVTCNSWQHIWLNEGFATYFTSCWFEHRDGRDEYLWGVANGYGSVIARDTGVAPADAGMASKAYDHPIQSLFRDANPYSKGASVLHMLRSEVGDELFFRSIAGYIDARKLDTAETADLRRSFEAACGRSFERFFSQWCDRPGVPHLTLTSSYDAASHRLAVTVEQTQLIDGANPAYHLRLPVVAFLPDGTRSTLVLAGDTRTWTQSFDLADAPAALCVDPELTCLASISIDQPPAAWKLLARAGPTVPARLAAINAMGALGRDGADDDARAILVEAAIDSGEHYGVRSAALASLGRLGPAETLLSIAVGPPADARVRKALIEAIAAAAGAETAGDSVRADAGELLRRVFAGDDSYAVRAAAVEGLAAIDSGHAADVIAAALRTESQHDQIRRAGLRALAEEGAPGSLDTAAGFAAPGTFAMTRPDAVFAVVALADQDRDKAFNILAALVESPELRTYRAAGDALVKLDDPRAIDVLESAAESPSRFRRFYARQWLEQLRAGEE